jgi:hypothetical protein
MTLMSGGKICKLYKRKKAPERYVTDVADNLNTDVNKAGFGNLD